MERLVDSHCHLDFDAFDDDRRAVLRRAADIGIDALVVPGVSPKQWRALPSFLDRHGGGPVALAAAVGIHPMIVPELTDSELDAALGALPEAAREAGAVAIGECGLDGLVAKRPGGDLERQRRAFRGQLDVARRLGLPVMLHVFRAQADALRVLAETGPLSAGGVVHSYSGSAELVPRWLAQGLHLSFAGSVTRPGAKRPRAAAAAVPPDRLLCETDGPDQTPHAAPTRRNEPAYLSRIIDALAEARGTSPARVGELTARNARTLFGLSPVSSP
jgi:TatD DNase family protein